MISRGVLLVNGRSTALIDAAGQTGSGGVWSRLSRDHVDRLMLRDASARPGLRIGATTGYIREIMAPLLRLAAARGAAPDNQVCAGDLADPGRKCPCEADCRTELNQKCPTFCSHVRRWDKTEG
jgi:hypothetical protein